MVQLMEEWALLCRSPYFPLGFASTLYEGTLASLNKFTLTSTRALRFVDEDGCIQHFVYSQLETVFATNFTSKMSEKGDPMKIMCSTESRKQKKMYVLNEVFMLTKAAFLQFKTSANTIPLNFSSFMKALWCLGDYL